MPARRGRLIPGIIALVALVAIGTALGAGGLLHDSQSTLHGPEVASELALAIQTQQSAPTAPELSCPAKEPVREGVSFECLMQPWRGSGNRTVSVTEIDKQGHLRWTIAAP